MWTHLHVRLGAFARWVAGRSPDRCKPTILALFLFEVLPGGNYLSRPTYGDTP